ncbi:MAG: putative oxidoreductase C-terminal domain-containing protein [Alphaproteobacteria bacterium]|jgi:predicted dehydrogenase|nr:putative oxidoreductase C-terminal domain-containing protein [Alphaproteobacteria bacterium]
MNITAPHCLMVVNPGHFHAALCLRARHSRLSDDVYVYAEDGPELAAFIEIIEAYNRRGERPSEWRLHIYRGNDYLDRLVVERPGDIAVIAGRNNDKMAAIKRMLSAGIHVLADKPLVIDRAALPQLSQSLAEPPLMMEIMTGRRETANRIAAALVERTDVFGSFDAASGRPAIEMTSTHHLWKLVNARPLIRPPWFFDVGIQGEGITDISTHLIDIAQWMIGDGTDEMELISARQWPTEIPLALFTEITGLDEFPRQLDAQINAGGLPYLCNGAFSCRIQGIAVSAEVLWAPRIPDGGGDSHRYRMGGTRGSVIVDHGSATEFESVVVVTPVADGPTFRAALTDAVEDLQDEFPGLSVAANGDGYVIDIPKPLRTTHEQHFAEVLDRFLNCVDSGQWPSHWETDVAKKYELLIAAKELSHAST